MSTHNEGLQELLDEFGYIVLNRDEPLDGINFEFQYAEGEKWYPMAVIGPSTYEEWREQVDFMNGDAESVGPYYYRVKAE